MTDPGEDLAARIVALEGTVALLQRDLGEVRQELAMQRPLEPAPPLRPTALVEAVPAKAPRLEPIRPKGPDLEVLVGRYGMLALATLLALAAVGTFVGWAVSHGLLGPVPRVLLGLAAAAGLGAWGGWLRPRERSFGDSLLGLSLAIVHVCAWSAGPGMHLVPPFLALALSAVASVALAGFALVQDDEPLWCVGFGGAAVAPFVTSSGEGTAPMLTAYAAAVLIAAGSALGSRQWKIAARVFGAAAALFVAAIASLPGAQRSAELALALPFAVAALGVVPFARGAAIRPRLRTLGLLAGAAALHVATSALVSSRAGAISAALAGLAWLVLVELVDSEPAGTLLDGFVEAGSTAADWFDLALIPAAFLGALGLALGPTDAATAAFASAAAVLVFVCSRREGALRDAAALVAFAAAIAAVSIATRASPRLEVAAVTAVSILFLFLESALPNQTWRWAPQVAMGLAAAVALGLLSGRPEYGYLPFGSAESAVALLVAAGLACAAFRARSGPVRAAAWIVAFLWVQQELAFAMSPSVSTLLLVSWYAVASVACVGFGRARAVPRLRHVGLGLGVVAALLALKAAWGLPSTGARIGAYLVVSVFLLGIAWWYRQPGPSPAAEP